MEPVEGGGAGVAVAALAVWLRACARALAAPKPICLKRESAFDS
jgi:hypothetical protein